VVEAGVALAILATVALASAGGGPGGAPRPPAVAAGPGLGPVPSSELAAWGRQAVPVITSLVDDLRATETHTADPSHPVTAWLRSDDSQLQRDLNAALRLAAPPDQTVRTVWSGTLARLTVAGRTLQAAASTIDPAAVALAHQQFAVAGNSLLQLGQAVTPDG
jgi:hypothetical protein